MRKTILGVLFLLCLPSCYRMPLYVKEPSVKLELELDLEEGEIPVPEFMKACFFSPEGGNLSLDHFVESTGGDLSVASGTYTLLVYSFGTEYVQIRGEGSLETIEAFTSDITASKIPTYRKLAGTKAEEEAPIYYAPDHLLVARQTITVPEFTGENIVAVFEAEPKTICETYSFEVTNVQGVDYVQSAEAYVTNQARSYFIGRDEPSTLPGTLWFPVEVDRERGVLNTKFNTFGVLPGGSRTYVHFVVRNSGGQTVSFSADITEQLASPAHEIVIEEEITIPQPPGSSGFSPEVNPWEEENTVVPIG
jgi:hypothetical protein